MSRILEKLGLGKERDTYEDDFIYFWDDIEDSEFITVERKTLSESIQDNIVLTLHFLMLIPVIEEIRDKS